MPAILQRSGYIIQSDNLNTPDAEWRKPTGFLVSNCGLGPSTAVASLENLAESFNQANLLINGFQRRAFGGVWGPPQACLASQMAAIHHYFMASKNLVSFERACLLDRLDRQEEAQQAYLDVLAQDMDHAASYRQLAALLARRGFTTAAMTVLKQAVACNADDVASWAALGHLVREAGDFAAAAAAYRAALQVEPTHAASHQGMSYLLDGVDEAAARRHRDAGFKDHALSGGVYRGNGAPVVVLRLVCARGGNVPTKRLLDERIFLTHTLVAEYASADIALPPHDLVFNAIGDADRSTHALDAAERLLPRTGARVFNPPARIRPTTRAGNAEALGRLDGVTAPRIATFSREALSTGAAANFGFPLLLRTPGFHTGQYFARIEAPEDLLPAVAMMPGEHLMLIEPLDARGADGFWRKYRVMLVDGALLPLHLAISADWKVHHFTAGMQQRADHRDEEAAFLGGMPAVLGPAAMAALGRVRDALGLDYGGIDFALAPQGGILLFEANATMTVSLPLPGELWQYRTAAARSVIEKTQEMLCGVTQRRLLEPRFRRGVGHGR